ncbi:MAG: PilZ domain-containing protein [Planctomycetes bacterium]|nr:PilZ domain-containing protein [Planctomycetota bacterium]
MSKQPDPKPVREPDGMRLERRVGSGRRSLWFRAEQVRLARPTAMKYLNPELAASEAITEAFFEAGRQAAVIVHPAAVPIFNVFRPELCIAMQWCEGDSLSQVGGNLSALAVASIGSAVMDCLSSLHATGRLHGNLSPGNILLGKTNSVWIDDFFQPPIIVDGDVRYSGDENYIAPEIVAGETGNWRADAFSLSRVLAPMLARDADADELRALLAKMSSDNPFERGDAPERVAAAFAAIRRAEEAKIGGGAAQLQRSARRYRRVPAEFNVSLRKRSATPEETATILMKIRDIGESGVFVETTDPAITVGSILELDFSLKGIDGNVHAFGIVRWMSCPPLPPGVGVQFVEVDQAGLARLREFMRGR